MRWVFFSGEVVARKVASLLADLGLDHCPNFFRDRQFLAALAAGVLFWLALAYIWPNPHADTMTLTALLSLCLFQPVMEELIFRGVIQTELLRKRWGQRNRAGFSTANWITSVAHPTNTKPGTPTTLQFSPTNEERKPPNQASAKPSLAQTPHRAADPVRGLMV